MKKKPQPKNKAAKALAEETMQRRNERMQADLNTMSIRFNSLVQRVQILESNIAELASNQAASQEFMSISMQDVSADLKKALDAFRAFKDSGATAGCDESSESMN